MTRQTTQKLITALYPRLSHEDTLQGESNSISNQENICQGGFHPKDEIPLQMEVAYFYPLSKLDKGGISGILPLFLHCSQKKVTERLSVHFQ